MVQLPLETSKQSGETVPPGAGPTAAWDADRDPGVVQAGVHWFRLKKKKKVLEFGGGVITGETHARGGGEGVKERIGRKDGAGITETGHQPRLFFRTR